MKQSFLAELQRRNVLRAGAFYAAAAWLLVQIATQVFPFFDIPNAVVRIVIVAAVIGFPMVLTFAWFYELTPQGLKRESEVDRSTPQMRASAKRFDRWIIAALGLAVAVLLADRFVPREQAQAPALTKAVTDKSIAVLPFENLSADKDNGYFADGIQDEILTHLAKIGALRVISRTSTQQFAAKPGNLSEIARQLGVANVLEGSVQKAGNAVRVTVQLIKAATDEHLWAETYDRKLDDIFGVESEVAQTIASSLQVQLTGGEQQAVAELPTTNTAAHEAFLQGRALETRNADFNSDISRRIVGLYAEAVRLDPNFALAWAHQAIWKSYMYLNFIDRSPGQLGEIKQAADTALRLRPDLGEAYLALGYYRYRGLRDLDGGLQTFEQARQRLPNNAEVLASISYIERRQGKWREAISHLDQATRLDPRNVQMLVELASNYSALRDFAEARSALDRALKIVPDSSAVLAAKAGTFQSEGNLPAAREVLAPLPVNAADPATFNVVIGQMLLERRFADALAALNDALAKPATDGETYLAFCHVFLAWVQRWSGDAVAAHASFLRSLDIIKALRKSEADDVNLADVFAIVYTGLGDETEAMRWAKRGVELNAGDAFQLPRMESVLVQVEGMFGHIDEAVAQVPQLLEVPNGETKATMRLNPVWDSLRGDARFRKLVDQDTAPAGAPQ
jgi:TolB-like protein/cytochrome c-type biogenesis protein CcmH/NrfG